MQISDSRALKHGYFLACRQICPINDQLQLQKQNIEFLNLSDLISREDCGLQMFDVESRNNYIRQCLLQPRVP